MIDLAARIENSFIQYAENNAFCIDEKFYSYADIKKIVYSIKKQIDEFDDKIKNKRVAVLCTDDVRTYSSLIAIWFSGCAYVPLGLHNPVERNLAILKEAAIDIIISTENMEDERYKSFTIVKPCFDQTSTKEFKLPDIKENDLAYILFTSGSTGLPKGVPISHKNLNAFILSFDKLGFNINSLDRCLQMYELTFDLSIVSFLIPILNGSCVYTVPNNGLKYLNVLKLIKERRLTVIQIVPSIIKLLRPLLQRVNLPDVRLCILGGEATYIDLLVPWSKSLPNCHVCNMYGPTEATIYCMYYKYSPEKVKNYNGLFAIGKGMEGVELIIINDNNEMVNANEKGELCISGHQVTSGYLNNQSKNNSSFIKIFQSANEKFFYKTGDMCYYDEEGDIYYCGRFDNQVKIQGFRVELSEIEFSVREKFNLNNVAIPKENKSGTLELVLAIENNENNEEEIINYLKRKLPEYMIPSSTFSMKEFPLNSSGKTDRNKIKAALDEHRR